MSLKPPWRQKNPLIEKACQAYHKQTAPAEAVKALDEMKVKSGGDTLSKEVVYSGKGWWKNAPTLTVALFKRRNYPFAVAFIRTKEELLDVKVGKYIWKPPVTVYYKGEEILRFPSEGGVGFKRYEF